ncbi:kazal-type proteinase inhibitor [Plakobranchus ocellatus]|uniref:Kazal-type proteinase inhibitor n=1 Tax=Plakobranchus ocellatus TaxID=259542 RepID=A0AAV4BKL8_9GAST|nr:kazal-type proteinase inhibitor [Plakobranchus ocellatus]
MSVSSILALTILCSVHLTLACGPDDRTDCPRISAPVCATFHKTFASPCVMENELCRLAKEGFHFTEQNNGDCCNGTVPSIYWPTCASDGHTYANPWDMSYSACRNQDYLTEAPLDTCPDFPSDK